MTNNSERVKELYTVTHVVVEKVLFKVLLNVPPFTVAAQLIIGTSYHNVSKIFSPTTRDTLYSDERMVLNGPSVFNG